MEIWGSTTNTIEAAALGTLGVPIRLDRTILAGKRRGEIRIRWNVGPLSSDGRIDTGRLRARFASGELERAEPEHPYLDCYRGIRCESRLRDAQHGRRIELRRCGAAGRWQYEQGGAGWRGKHGALVTTGNAAAAAACGVVGVPVRAMEGPTEGRYKYYLSSRGYAKAAGGPGADAVYYLKGWAEGWLEDREPESAFLYAVRAIGNHRKFTRLAKTALANIALLKPGSPKGAMVREDAPGGQFDKVARFFNR